MGDTVSTCTQPSEGKELDMKKLEAQKDLQSPEKGSA